MRRLLKQDIIYHIKVKSREKARNDPAAVIYQQGKAVDYFVLILEGRVEVTVGKENMMFESGPFTYFGSQVLTVNIGIGKYIKINFSLVFIVHITHSLLQGNRLLIQILKQSEAYSRLIWTLC